MFKKFLLSLALFTQSHTSVAKTCQQVLSSYDKLSTLDLLKVANSGDYKVSILETEIEGRFRTVVILGESHLKTKASSVIGQHILKKFNKRGLEGADLSLLWGEVFFTFFDKFNTFLLSLNDRNESSTISDAFKMSDDLFIENFDLEEGHIPNLSEQLASIKTPLSIAACVGAVCGISLDYFFTGNSFSSALSTASFSVLGFNLFQSLGSRLLSNLSHLSIYRALFSIQRGFLDGRDLTMAKNTMLLITEENLEEPLLLIVGMDHVKGIEEHLISSYEFKKLDLDSSLKSSKNL